MTDKNKLNTDKREVGAEILETLTNEKFMKYVLSGNYETYLITYRGDLAESLAKIDYADVFITERYFAIAYVKNGMLSQFLKDVPEIILIEPNYPYTLSELSIKDSGISYVINKGNLPLDGEGVIVGIIGTGIDYLNSRFINEAGESRIVAMWDQTILTGPFPIVLGFGTEYTKEDLTSIIRAKEANKLPNEPLPSSNEEGFDTAIAGIIGGRKLEGDDLFSSIAPKCEFAIVNLAPATESYLDYIGVEKDFKNVYPTSRIAVALRYLSYVQNKLKKPMVVYLPLGCNIGERNGGSILEQYIDIIGQKRDFCIVTNTGSEGHGETHNSGTINATGETNEIPLNVSENQKSLFLSLYTKDSDIVIVTIISPSGEPLVKIAMDQNLNLISNVVNNIQYTYGVQRTPGANISLNLMIRNLPAGIWKISLYGEYIYNGLFDIFLFQKELLQPGTRFVIPDPFTTLTTPCSSATTLVTSYYDNVRNIIAPSSGRGYPRSGAIKPTVTCEGIELLTTGVNNSLVNSSGAAMGGAILAGAIALIYQWGLVQGNNPRLFPVQIRNLLIASTVKLEDIIYPNEEWGFGRFCFEKLDMVLKAESRSNNEPGKEADSKNTTREYLYVNIPNDLLCRLK